MKIGIIGAGAWGTALAISSARGGNDITLWAFGDVAAKNMQKGRENDNLPGVKIPENVFVTNDMINLRDCDAWLVATPSEFFAKTMQKAREFWGNQPIIICTKGIDFDGNFMVDVAAGVGYDPELIGVMSGPQFAADVARGAASGATIAGGPAVLNAANAAFPEMTLVGTDDIIGVEICGAAKNAIAILMGYMEGQGKSESERALRLTETYGEIVQLGRHLGAHTETFLGLCGLGDLFLSATSRGSRNYRAGIDIARGMQMATLVKKETIEGVNAARGLLKIAKKAGISTPNIEFLVGLVK